MAGGNTLSSSVDDFMSNVNTSDSHQLTYILDYLCHRFAASSNATVPPLCMSVEKKGGKDEEEDPIQDTLGIPLASKILLTSFFVVILVTSLLGNTLVLTTIVCNRSSWTNVHISILSLAISDVLVSSTCIPISIDQVLNAEWTLGSMGCKALPFFMQLAMSANMLTLCCLAADRYLAIVYPMKFCSLRTVQTTQAFVVLSWIISLADAVPLATYFELSQVCGRWGHNGQCIKGFTHFLCMTKDGVHLVSKRNLKWISFGILFLSPTIVMGVTYGIVIYTLWLKTSIGTGIISATASRNHYKRKAVKMLICVVSLFLISWAPFQIWILVACEENLDATSRTQTLNVYLKCLALSSTAYNPIIYAFMNQKFRATFKNILLRRSARVAPRVIINVENQQCIQLAQRGGDDCPISNNTTPNTFQVPKTTSSKLTGSSKVII